MKPDPILEELWRVKDDLAREAGYDLDRIFAELRAAEALHPGPVIRSAEELRAYAAKHQRAQATGLALNPTFATGGCIVAQVIANQGWLAKGL